MKTYDSAPNHKITIHNSNRRVPGVTVDDGIIVVSFFGLTAWCFLRFFSARAAMSIFSLNDILSNFDSFSESFPLCVVGVMVPTRLINGSIVLVMFWPSTFFVSVSIAFGILCCVVDDTTTSESNRSSLENVSGGNLFSLMAIDGIDEDIKCISPRWCCSPFPPRVIFTRKLPTVFRAPSVSDIRENADWDKSRAPSSWCLFRRTFGRGNTSSSERYLIDASSMRRAAITSSSGTSPSSGVKDGRCSWWTLANAGGRWMATFLLTFVLKCAEKSVSGGMKKMKMQLIVAIEMDSNFLVYLYFDPVVCRMDDLTETIPLCFSSTEWCKCKLSLWMWRRRREIRKVLVSLSNALIHMNQVCATCYTLMVHEFYFRGWLRLPDEKNP